MAMLDIAAADGADGFVWLNTAHQGVLPDAAVPALEQALAWKRAPFHLTGQRFGETAEGLRATLARLLDADADDVALANAASYGLHVLAHAMLWAAGDEILLVARDFPSNHLPWTLLEDRGVATRVLRPAGGAPTAEEVAAALSPRTRLVCLSWVFSFTGHVTDLAAVGEVCRARGVAFAVNASQGLGAMPLSVRDLPVDALVSVGFKWLRGPYGTGLLWLHPRFRRTLRPTKRYWLAVMDERDLSRETLDLDTAEDGTARAYDVFGTASFFNTLPWQAAVEHLLAIGVDAVARANRHLVQRLLDGLDRRVFDVLSPEDGAQRSALVYLRHREAERNPAIAAALADQRIFIASRAGALRVAPHHHNSEADIDRLLSALHALA